MEEVSSMAQPSWDAEKMLDAYIYDYLIKRNFHDTARAFIAEKLVSTFPVAIDAPGGFLLEWWLVFWDIFIARSRTPSDNAASTIQGQDQQILRCPPQKQQQMQPSHLSNLLQMPNQRELQARRARVLQGRNLDKERMRILANGHTLVQDDPQLSALNADLLLKQKQHLQQSFLSQYAKKANYILQQGKVVPSGGVRVDSCLPNDVVGSNHNFQSVSSTNFQKASSIVGKKRKECSPALHPSVNCYFDHSRSGPASQFPATVRSAMEQSPGLYHSSCYDSTNYARAESELCLPTTVPNQKNVGYASFASDSEGLACPTQAIQLVGKDPTMKDNGVLQIESMLSRIDTEVGEKSIQLDVGSEGYTFSEILHLAGALDKVECCQFSSDGKLLASGGSDNKVTLWCSESFQIKSELGEDAQAMTDIRFSSCVSWLATSSVDGTIRVWDADNPGQLVRRFTGHSTAVSSIDFHPQKDDLICSCDNTKEIRYWTLKNSRCAGMIKGGATYLRFQPDSGRYLATAGKNVVSLYDVETQFCRQRMQDHKSDVHVLCWDFTGYHLASVSDDLVSVWRIGSGNNIECMHQLICSGNKFRSCVFHPVHPSILIIGCYKGLELWNMAENKRVTIDGHQDLISSLSASSSNGYVASASHDKSIKIWK